MAVLNTVSFEDSVDVLNRIFTDTQDDPFENKMVQSGIVKVMSINSESGGQRLHKEPSNQNEYASVKVEGGVISEATIQQGYHKYTQSITIADKFNATIEMRRLGKNDEIGRGLKKIGKKFACTQDLHLSLVLGQGDSTTYTDNDGNVFDISTGDGLSLWNDSHTLTGSSTTYSNILPANPQVSEGSFETMAEIFNLQTYSNLGENTSSNPTILFSTTHSGTCNEIRRLIQSTARVSAPNDGVTNVFQGKYKHIELPRLDMNANGLGYDSTKRKMWGMCDPEIATFFHDVYMEGEVKVPTSGGNGEDINTLNWTYSTIGMYGSCVVAGRGLAVSFGTGV